MRTTITPRQLEYARAYLDAEPRAAVAARLGIVARAMKHCDATVDHRGRVEYAFDKHGLIAFVEDIAAALAARGES